MIALLIFRPTGRGSILLFSSGADGNHHCPSDHTTISPTPGFHPQGQSWSHRVWPSPTQDLVDFQATAVSPTPIPLAERQQIFSEVWYTVYHYYLYRDFHGVNWIAVREEFRPLIDAAASNEEFYRLLARMVRLLDDEHSRFVGPEDVVTEQTMTVGVERRAGIGVMTMMTDEGLRIRQVYPNSPASLARLLPDDLIVAVDGAPCTAVSCPSLDGPDRTLVQITVARAGSPLRDLVLRRQSIGIETGLFAQRLTGDIAYLYIPSLWVSTIAEQVSGVLTDMVVERPLQGIILDLRGNTGGWREVMVEVLTHFVSGEVGVFYDRRGQTPLVIPEGSGPHLHHLPIVVIIDHTTASYGEVMAAVIQDVRGGYVIGTPSSGNTETIYAYDLKGGARLWLAQEGFLLRNGTNLEGRGVQPNLLLPNVQRAANLHDDFAVRAAIQWILHLQ